MAEKIGAGVRYVSQFITGFVIGFIKGWELTLVMFAVSPFLAIAGGASTSAQDRGLSSTCRRYSPRCSSPAPCPARSRGSQPSSPSSCRTCRARSRPRTRAPAPSPTRCCAPSALWSCSGARSARSSGASPSRASLAAEPTHARESLGELIASLPRPQLRRQAARGGEGRHPQGLGAGLGHGRHHVPHVPNLR